MENPQVNIDMTSCPCGWTGPKSEIHDHDIGAELRSLRAQVGMLTYTQAMAYRVMYDALQSIVGHGRDLRENEMVYNAIRVATEAGVPASA